LPRHLIVDNKAVRIVNGLKSFKMPVYFCYYKQPYYSKLQQAPLPVAFPQEPFETSCRSGSRLDSRHSPSLWILGS
jgi:hypothetical protein